jgi:hypothetical protein
LKCQSWCFGEITPLAYFCNKNDFSTGFIYFTDKTLNILTYSFAGTVLANIIEKCKGWVNDFLALGSLERKGFDIALLLICIVLYTMFRFSLKKYGKLLRFSGQGVEKINDDIQKIHHSKTNKWDATVDALQVRKRIEHLTSENCERDKRNYTKCTNEYWSDIILSIEPLKRLIFLRKCHSYLTNILKMAQSPVQSTTFP